MLVATAVFTLAQILPLGFLRSRDKPTSDLGIEPATGRPDRIIGRPSIRVMLPLLAFTGLYVLVYAGEPIKYGYLPIYMNDDLQLPAVVSGAVIGLQPLIELLLMPVAVIVARRIRISHLHERDAGRKRPRRSHWWSRRRCSRSPARLRSARCLRRHGRLRARQHEPVEAGGQLTVTRVRVPPSRQQQNLAQRRSSLGWDPNYDTRVQ